MGGKDGSAAKSIAILAVTRVRFPALMWLLIAICNYTSRESNALSDFLGYQAHALCAYKQQNTSTYNIQKSKTQTTTTTTNPKTHNGAGKMI